MELELVVNGFSYVASFDDKDVEGAFVPLLRGWTELRREAGRRVVVFLAAPPGTGKTTLALFLEELSRRTPGCAVVQALGIDGFHYPNAYLDAHAHVEDGVERPLRARKGAPFTYDVPALRRALTDARAPEPRPWPAYSRETHDVVPDALPVTGEVLLVEGNYLLCPTDGWDGIWELADQTVMLRADPEKLRERLVGRKVRGGLSRTDAEAWYASSDEKNVRLVLERSIPADVELTLG